MGTFAGGNYLEHVRHAAMLQRHPVHTFMFDDKGTFLTANKSAIKASLHGKAGLKLPEGRPISLQALFRLGIYSGGKAEADAAYDEAMEAVFSLQVDQHCHVQCRVTPSGERRWELIELWPLEDPITKQPAVMVKKSSITRQRQLELQLEQQQEALQLRYQELEQDSTQLEVEAQAMAERLQAVMHENFQPDVLKFDAETPVDKALAFLQSYIKGQLPSAAEALQLYRALNNAGLGLRVPMQLETQLLQVQAMDSDVGQSMFHLLQGNTASALQVNIMQDSNNDTKDSGAEMLPQHVESIVPSSMTPVVERLLKDAESNWQFDVFEFARQSPGQTLSLLACYLYQQSGFTQQFGLDQIKLRNYYQKIESGYVSSNPYHNSVHAASVLQLSHMILFYGGLPDTVMSPEIKMSTYWSAIVHDYEHGGLNNDFLIKTAHSLAITYNDQSPLENHHCSAAVKQLFVPEQYFLPAKPFEEWQLNAKQMRTCSLHQVLGTDMKKHFDITSRFQAIAQRSKEPGDATTHWDKVSFDDSLVVYQMVLKCADIGHLTASPRMHRQWACQLEEEFFRQGDQEKAIGLPVSPLMDRDTKGGMTRSQVGFYSIVGIPMFKAMAELFEGCQPLLDGAMANLHHWEGGTDLADLPA